MNSKISKRLEQLLHETPQVLLDNNKLRHAIRGVFDVDLLDVNYNHIGELVDKIDDAVLHRYFSTIWQPQTKKFKYSGLALIDEINALKPQRVLDIGCGYNEFKGKINNLTGIDPYNKKADVCLSILEYEPKHSYNVVISLGSINFGSTDKIFAEIKKAVTLTLDSGWLYFRVNPGCSHEAKESEWINFYNWTPTFIMNVADTLGVKVIDLRNDSNNRIYFILKK